MSGTARRPVTTRMAVKIDKFVFTQFVEASIERDLQNIAGRFELTCVDQARLARALPIIMGQIYSDAPPLDAGLACEISIDREIVLVGWVDKLHLHWSADKIECRIGGRDKTGDLVDCAALPEGPAEFRNVDLLYVAKKVCEKFGITVRADVDIGAPFDRLSLNPHETAMSFLDKAARQRSVLVTSDGVGGLVLTRGGSTRAPSPLIVGPGGNVENADAERNWDHRFSDYYVKGQTARVRKHAAALDSTVVPLAEAPPPPSKPGQASKTEASGIVMTGHAIDPEIKRYRPTVRITRTQSGMSSVQEQAEWALRVARGQSDCLRYHLLDWRTGRQGELWRPNQVSAVYDAYAGFDKDMLIAGVHYRFSEHGAKTELRVVGVTAYDRINEAERKRHRAHGSGAKPKLDSTPVDFVAA